MGWYDPVHNCVAARLNFTLTNELLQNRNSVIQRDNLDFACWPWTCQAVDKACHKVELYGEPSADKLPNSECLFQPTKLNSQDVLPMWFNNRGTMFLGGQSGPKETNCTPKRKKQKKRHPTVVGYGLVLFVFLQLLTTMCFLTTYQ